MLTPELIGRARGDYTRFELERVWHLLAWFGRPRQDQRTLLRLADRHSA